MAELFQLVVAVLLVVDNWHEPESQVMPEMSQHAVAKLLIINR